MKRMIMTAGPARAAWAVLLVTLLFCTWVPSAAAEDAAAGLLSGRDSVDTSGETGAAETDAPERDTGAGTTADKTVRVEDMQNVIKEFGAFVEILPGLEGLCHISELSDRRVPSVDAVCKVGDKMRVKCIGVDDRGRIKLSRREAMKEADAAAQA